MKLASAFDQSAPARRAHELNHGVPTHPHDLATVSPEVLSRAGADGGCWLMSPPCQPFSRRGTGADVEDPRCRGLLRLIELMPRFRPRRVLLENVVGFHGSRAHALLREALRGLGHDVADVESCPSCLGWPVRRPRQFVVSSSDGLAPIAPAMLASGAEAAGAEAAGAEAAGAEAAGAEAAAPPMPAAPTLDDCLDSANDEDATLDVPAEWLDKVQPVLPPALPLSTITRSYGHAASGGGPILPTRRGARFLSPDEILRLHGFPPGFRFPPELDLRTRWRLSGNSVHVASVRQVTSAWAS